jgi:hypothetical protein
MWPVQWMRSIRSWWRTKQIEKAWQDDYPWASISEEMW